MSIWFPVCLRNLFISFNDLISFFECSLAYDLLYDKTPFKSLKEELKYCAEKTDKLPHDFNKIFEFNAKLAQSLNKSAIANLWMTIRMTLQEQHA